VGKTKSQDTVVTQSNFFMPTFTDLPYDVPAGVWKIEKKTTARAWFVDVNLRGVDGFSPLMDLERATSILRILRHYFFFYCNRCSNAAMATMMTMNTDLSVSLFVTCGMLIPHLSGILRLCFMIRV
jgi:hypothetical protein